MESDSILGSTETFIVFLSLVKTLIGKEIEITRRTLKNLKDLSLFSSIVNDA